jgi:hypothetical protein
VRRNVRNRCNTHHCGHVMPGYEIRGRKSS